ncbi:hypothetical protein JW935_04740 [candidate division KSB1 bacterium]|nr:hypothetical protein [candidate division KSB1 bacterium]
MKTVKIHKWFVLFSFIFLFGVSAHLYAQAIGASGELKWLRINSLHAYFSEQGAESETGGTENNNVTFSWPGQYGISQSTMRANGMWLGCKNYYDAKVDKIFPVMVTNVGPKPNEYEDRPIFDAVDFKLVGKFEHPIVAVDGELATSNTHYDVLDDIDENLPADRMILIKNHTSIGVTVTKKVYAFTQQNHENYYIYDYVLKNTGIIDNEGTTNGQKIKDFYFYLTHRYALSGEAIIPNQPTWGASNSAWGRNVVTDVMGTDPASPDYKYRAHMAWYSPHSEQPVEDDWGCPNYNDDGVLAAAKFVGFVVLHADKSAAEKSDDLSQPHTTHYQDTDSPALQRATSQYDENIMNQRYDYMTAGHAVRSQAEEVELSGLYADKWGPGIGGTTIVEGFGPYQLETGDSLHFVLAGGVAGLSRDVNRKVGGNWLLWTNHTANPTLLLPDGSETTDYNNYKKEWVLSCKDSLEKLFENALANYAAGYSIPQPPPPPKEFRVKSGGDRIQFSWSDNAASWPNFDGYVVYRSEGSVMAPKTVYKKLFECSGANVVHSYDDTSAVRGFDYYYYIQSKDDGSTNRVNPGAPLRSNMFWTLTSKPATLQRTPGNALEEVRVVPNPYDIRARAFQFGEDFQYDRIAFYELPPMCKIKIFTERGDLIWEKDHTDGSGDELWDSMTSSGQIIVSGIYILVVEVTEDIEASDDVYAARDYVDPKSKKQVYQKGDLLYKAGQRMYNKGESVFRKFVVIR